MLSTHQHQPTTNTALSSDYTMSPEASSIHIYLLKLQLEVQVLATKANAAKYDKRVMYWKDKYVTERDAHAQKKRTTVESEQTIANLQRKLEDLQGRYQKLKRNNAAGAPATSTAPIASQVRVPENDAPESPEEPNVSPILQQKTKGTTPKTASPAAQLHKSSITAKTVEPSEIFNSEEDKELNEESSSLDMSLDTQELLKSDAPEEDNGTAAPEKKQVEVFEEDTTPPKSGKRHISRKRGREEEASTPPADKQQTENNSSGRRKRRRLDLGQKQDEANNKAADEKNSPAVALRDRTNAPGVADKKHAKRNNNSLHKEKKDILAKRNAAKRHSVI